MSKSSKRSNTKYNKKQADRLSPWMKKSKNSGKKKKKNIEDPFADKKRTTTTSNSIWTVKD